MHKGSAERVRSLSSTSAPALAHYNAKHEANATRLNHSLCVAPARPDTLLQETQSSRGKRRSKFMNTYVDRKQQQRLSKSSLVYQQKASDSSR